MGVRVRRMMTGAALLVTAAVLTGCTHPVEDATETLADGLRDFEFVEYVLVSASEKTLFDDPFSSVSIDVVAGTTAEQLDELVSYWRFGVDAIDARWLMGISQPGDEGEGYDDFSVAGAHSVADLTALARYWHLLGERADSAGLSIDDYSADRDGFIHLEYPAQPSNALQEVIRPLAEEAVALPGRFQWSIATTIPAGTVHLAGTNLLPDDHMLAVLAELADVPHDRLAIGFTGSVTVREFGPVMEPRMYVAVALPELDMGVLEEMVDRLAHDERAVVLDFTVEGESVAHLDPYQCSFPDSEDIYGPLTYDLWQYWLRDGGSTADGSTADTCLSYG